MTNKYSFWKVVSRTAAKLALLSIIYYIFRYGIVTEDGFLSISFLLIDTIGYLLVLVLQFLFIYRSTKVYIRNNDKITRKSGLKLGLYSMLLARLFSFPLSLFLLRFFISNSEAMANTMTILGLPFAMIIAAILGAIYGLVSELILKF